MKHRRIITCSLHYRGICPYLIFLASCDLALSQRQLQDAILECSSTTKSENQDEENMDCVVCIVFRLTGTSASISTSAITIEMILFSILCSFFISYAYRSFPVVITTVGITSFYLCFYLNCGCYFPFVLAIHQVFSF